VTTEETLNLSGVSIVISKGPSGYHKLVVDAAFTPVGTHVSQSLSGVYAPTMPDGANKALVQVFVQNARYKVDGTDPTTSVGFRLTKDDPPTIVPIAPGGSLKFIEETAGAVLQLQWGY
jgi:hypothetical protein